MRSSASGRVASLLGAVLVAACSGSDAPPAPDGGIPMVHSSAPLLTGDAAPRLAAEPELVIGVRDGDPAYVFGGLRGTRLREDGGIVVVDAQAQVRYFDAAGRHVRTVGGKGSAPGEFQLTQAVQPLPGDSLLIVDLQLNRLTVLGPAGGLVRTQALPPMGFPPPALAGVLPDGRLVHVGRTRPDGYPPGVVELASLVMAVSPDGNAADTLVARMRPAMYGVGNGMVGLPYAHDLSVKVDGETLLVGDATAGSLERLAPDGRVLARYSWAGGRRPVDEAMKAAYRQQMAPMVARLTDRDPEDALAAMPFPDSLPAFGAVMLDPSTGRLWLSGVAAEGARPAWRILDRQGVWLADVELPERFSLSNARGDRIVGTWWDEFDVPYVHVYRVIGLPEG